MGAAERTYLSRLVAHIIANVQIELSDVQVRYDCAETSAREVRRLLLAFSVRMRCTVEAERLSVVARSQRQDSATLEVGFVRLINANRNWELEFTPQSNANMESRKVRVWVT